MSQIKTNKIKWKGIVKKKVISKTFFAVEQVCPYRHFWLLIVILSPWGELNYVSIRRCYIPLGKSLYGNSDIPEVFWVLLFDLYEIPRWLNGKEPACHGSRCGLDPWVGKILWRRKWQPTSILLPGKAHGQRRLVLQPMGS